MKKETKDRYAERTGALLGCLFILCLYLTPVVAVLLVIAALVKYIFFT